MSKDQGTGFWDGPLLTILKVHWSRPLAWHTSVSPGGMVLELFSKQGTSITWGETGGSGELGGTFAPEGQCWTITESNAGQSLSPFSL